MKSVLVTAKIVTNEIESKKPGEKSEILNSQNCLGN